LRRPKMKGISKKIGHEPIDPCPVNSPIHLHRPQHHHHQITIVVLIPLRGVRINIFILFTLDYIRLLV